MPPVPNIRGYFRMHMPSVKRYTRTISYIQPLRLITVFFANPQSIYELCHPVYELSNYKKWSSRLYIFIFVKNTAPRL